uniref:Putative ovule protein n=1 Tax=Solanum chacoense TaxID=4108 RepID=A0A0V0GGX3_SOLCH
MLQFCCLLPFPSPATYSSSKGSVLWSLGLRDDATLRPQTMELIPAVLLPFLFRNGSKFQGRVCFLLIVKEF